MKRGLFFVIEGPDGLGKSTQASILKDYLECKGRRVLLTREPGGSWFGDAIRNILLTSSTDHVLTPEAELFLFLADRANHVQQVIVPTLASGMDVVCDRYVHSTYVYQSVGRGFNIEKLKELHALATDHLYPDLSIILKGKGHRQEPLNSLDVLSSTYHDQISMAYDRLADFIPNTHYINGDQALRFVYNDISYLVDRELEKYSSHAPHEST